MAKFRQLWETEDMKKQASDQQFHDRRYQERKQAEAAKKLANKHATREVPAQPSPVRAGTEKSEK
jgi:hypothetical protein